MTTEEKSFRNRLICRNAIQGQKETAETLIREQLFKICFEKDLENGNTIPLKEMVEVISNRLGLPKSKKQISEHVKQVLQSGKYKVKINEEDIIVADLNEMDKRAKKYQDDKNREANETFAKFVELVETHISQLEEQKIKITEQNITKQFSEEQRQRDYLWIDLAIGKVLRERNQIEL